MLSFLPKIVKVAWNWKKIKKAVREIADVFVALKALHLSYEKANVDGDISPSEMKYIIEQTGSVVKESAEAVEAFRKIF